MTRPPDRILELDLMRVWSIVAIVVIHALSYVYPDGYAGGVLAAVVRPGTYVALGALFFASGFGVSLTSPAISTWTGVGVFMRRRLGRIYPLYLVAVTIFLAAWVRPLSPWNVAAHLAMVQMWLVPYVGPTAQTLWFVSVLVLMYVAFVTVRFRSASTVATVVRSALVFAVLAGLHFALDVGDVRFLLYYPAFSLGVAAAMDERLLAAVKRPPVRLSALAVVAASSALLDLDATGETPVMRAIVVALTIAAVPLVWWVAEGWLRRSSKRRFLQQGVYASFGLYLFHRPVLATVSSLLPETSLVTRYVALAVGAVALAWVVGWVLQTGYDAAARRVGIAVTRLPEPGLAKADG